MSVDNFLKKVSNITLNNTKIFEIKAIKDIDKSPCDKSITQIIDFDTAKEKIVEHYKLQMLSSCDGLRLIDNNNYIDFIELKSLKNILKYSKFDNISEFETKIKDLNLTRKIIESHSLIERLLYDRELDFSKNERVIFTDITKRYIIVFDTDLLNNPREFIFNSFSLLSIQKKLNDVILKEIKASELMNISTPIIKNCITIDELYN